MKKARFSAVVLLLFTMGMGSQPHPPYSNRCLDSDRGLKDPRMAKYKTFLKADNAITAVLRICNWEVTAREKMYEKLSGAERTGVAVTAALPASYGSLSEGQVVISLSKTEAIDVYTAKVAHALWIELNHKVPWSLLQFSSEELQSLLLPMATFSKFDAAHNRYAISYILDHSPRYSYGIAHTLLGTPTNHDPARVVEALLEHLRNFSHGSTSDDQRIITVRGMFDEKISRNGCQTTTRYVRALAHSLNIPTKLLVGYYAGDAHSTAAFIRENQVLSHGDDPYNGYFRATPTNKLLDTYSRWSREVLAYRPGDARGAHNSFTHSKKMYAAYPSLLLKRDFCRNGQRSFLDDEFGGWLTIEEINRLEQTLLSLTANCTG